GRVGLHAAVDLSFDGGVPRVDLRARCFQTRVHVGVELLEGPPGTDAHQHQVVDLFEVGCGCLERRLEVQRQTDTQTGVTCFADRRTGIRYRFQMDGHPVEAGLTKLVEVRLRRIDHEVAV